MTRPANSLTQRINRAFILQSLFIALAVLLSVFFAKVVLDEILINEAIVQESEYYWEQHARDIPIALPRTRNLTGYASHEELPDDVRDHVGEDNGFYLSPDDQIVIHVSGKDGGRLYLLYQRGQVDALAIYYGMIPLSVVLILLYVSMWAFYRYNRKTLSPIVWLADQLDRLDFSRKKVMPDSLRDLHFDPDDEIRTLIDAIVQMAERLEQHVERERQFTRDASHELRSPLTVVRIAADMLLAEQELTDSAKGSVHRIKRAVDDMDGLTEVFLLLARDSSNALTVEHVSVNDIVREEIERAKMLHAKQAVEVVLNETEEVQVMASDKVLSVLLGNVIRNALQYTEEGSVSIRVGGGCFTIHDTGVGIPGDKLELVFSPFYRNDDKNTVGYGIGLTIVKRLSDRFGWPVRINSEPGQGTYIEICFSS